MKNWFKFNWFSSDERKELVVEPAKTLLVEEKPETKSTRPYHRAVFSSGNITIVDHDGDTISATGDYALFTKVKQCVTMREVEDLLIPKELPKTTKEVEQEIRIIENNLDVLKERAEFVVNGTSVTLKGVSLPIPAPIVSSFIEILERQKIAMQQKAVRQVVDEYDDQLVALKMFWLKLALNPLPQSREDLLTFIRRNDVRITKNGNLILYRRIVSKTGADINLVTFVTQNYYRLKKEGADPRNFAINRMGDWYSLTDLRTFDPQVHSTPFCNLQQMYLELPLMETNTFTAAHDKTVDIKLGAIYRITKGKINLDNGLCAAGGLHAAAVTYNYSGFGDMPVVVLVNPSKAITVPTGDTGKLRTTEMFVACVNDKPQGVHFDESALGSFDSEYHDLSLEELEQAARSKSFEDLSVENEVPSVSLTDLNSIKDMLRGRIKAIV